MALSFAFLCGLFCALSFSAQAQSVSKKFPLSATVKNYILQQHNDFRNNVAQGKVAGQPKAKEMKALVWDDALANKAKTWSEFCYGLKHSNGSNQLGYQWVGENLAYTWLGKASMNNDADVNKQFKVGFDMWAGEAKDFSYPKTCKSVCGHYTQLVWAKTQKVGCGITQCDGLQTVGGPGTLYGMIVCNYAPGGNWNNEDPYVRA